MTPRRTVNLYHAIKLKEELSFKGLMQVLEFLKLDRRIPPNAQVTLSRDLNPGCTTLLVTWEGNDPV